MARPTVVHDVQVVLRGDLPADIGEYARGRISQMLERLDGRPVLHVRIRLTHDPGAGIDRPVRAQGNVTFKKGLVRAQVAGRNAQEAVDRLRERLRGRLVRHEANFEARRGARPSAELAEWRHAEQPADRPPYYPRPVEDREVVRHKSFSPRRIGPDEAAQEMDQFDYDFHLFTDAETGRDAVVSRAGPTGYQVTRLTAGPEPATTDPPVTLDSQPAPRLHLDEARQRLELAGLPFVFFTDATTKRGAVLYHRYDGHYGLITPAT